MCVTGRTGKKGKHGVNVGATPSGIKSFKGWVDLGLSSSSLKQDEREFSVVVLPRERVAAKT